MYIDFIDTLRNIQNGIYPKVKLWREEVETLRDETSILRNETEELKNETFDISGEAKASEMNAKSWATQDEWESVRRSVWDASNDTMTTNPLSPTQYSALHWAKQSKHLAEIEKWRAEAAQMTACSFSNEAVNTPVKVYTSNGDGTFTSRTLDNVFSALHYRQDSEQLTGHKRWVESQTASEGQTIFGFQKNINHADVYVNGSRMIEGSCYTRILKDLHFVEPLHENDTVTVSGMEAITGDEFTTTFEQTKEVYKETQKIAWEAKASEMTAESFTSEPLDTFVKIYTSNGDGTYSVDTTTLYSALHWSIKMNLLESYLVIVDTYADLELLNVNDAKIVYIRGGQSINDGRHGLFHYDSTKSGINNGGTIINGWIREYDGPMNIMWFNVIGDGIIDDTIEIQNAIQWDDNILFPAEKVFLISDTILFENKNIISEDVVFKTIQSTGTAINIVGTRESNGIKGNLNVEWVDNDLDLEKISFKISDSRNASYELSSDGATVGIKLDPSLGDVKYNDFKIGNMNNNTVGIFISKEANGYNVHNFRFHNGLFTHNIKLYPHHHNFSIASHIYVEDTTVEKGIFHSQSLKSENNINNDFLLTRISGQEIELTPYELSNTNGQSIIAEISGKNNIYNATHLEDKNAYIREEAGYDSKIDISAANGITLRGTENHIENDENITFEYSSNGTKSLMTLENLSGLSALYPVSSETHEISQMKVEGGYTDTISSAYRTRRYNSSTRNESVIANDFIHITNEIDTNFTNRYEVNIYDSTDSNRSTKFETKITDNIDTLLANKTSLTIDESIYEAKLVKDDLTINDGTDFSHLSQYELKINDSTESTTLDKFHIAITNGIVDYHVDRDNAKFTDGVRTNERTAIYSEIIDGVHGANSNKATATNINIDSSQEHFEATASHTKINDSVDSNYTDKLSITIKDNTDTTNITKTTRKTFDSTDSNTDTKLSSIITDGTDTNSATKTFNEIFDSTDKSEMDKLKFKVSDTNDSTVITKTETIISDSSDSSSLTKTQHKITDGTDENLSTKLLNKISDDINIYIVSKTQEEFTDGMDTATLSRLHLKIEDSTKSFETDKERLEFIDGINSSTQSAEDYIVGDGTDNAHLSKMELKIGTTNTNATINKTSFVLIDPNKSFSINTEALVFMDGSKQNTVSAEGSITIDTGSGNTNTRTDIQNKLEAGTNSNTSDASQTIITNGSDTTEINATKVIIGDGTSSNENTKSGYIISNDANINTAQSTGVQITDGTSTNASDATKILLNGSGTESNTIKKDSIDIVSGGNSNIIKANQNIMISGATTRTVTALDSIVTDGTDTSHRSNTEIKVNDATKDITITKNGLSITEGSEIASISKDAISISNGADTSTSTVNSLTITDGNNTSVLDKKSVSITNGARSIIFSTDSGSEIITDDGTSSALFVKNQTTGGRGLNIDVANSNDSAIEISEAGIVSTKITSGPNWTIAGREVIWSSGSAPASGVWNLGDIAFDAAPVAGGKIGWVFVSKQDETGDITTGSPDILNVTNTTAFAVGDNVSGPGIPIDSFVTQIDTVGNKLTLNTNATATTVGITLSTTGWKPFGAIDA